MLKLYMANKTQRNFKDISRKNCDLYAVKYGTYFQRFPPSAQKEIDHITIKMIVHFKMFGLKGGILDPIAHRCQQ